MTNTVRTTMGERSPEPGLETAIAAGMRGELEFAAVMSVLAGWPLILPSSTDFSQPGGQPTPIIVDNNADPSAPSMVALFTSRDRVGDWERKAPFLLTASGALLLRGVQPNVGVVLNPGSAPATELTPEGIPIIRNFSTDLDPFAVAARPLSPLEVALARLKAGTGNLEEALGALRGSNVVVAATSPTVDVGGAPYVAIFTNEDYIRPEMTWATDLVTMPFAQVATQAAAGFVINPMSAIWHAVPSGALR